MNSNALVIGIGRQGRRHARVLAGLGFDVETVDPVDSEATYESIEETDGDYSVVAVAVPIRSLSRVAVEAIFEISPEIALVEKPLGVSIEEVERIDEAARFRDTLVVPGYTERWNPALMQLEAMIADGDREEAIHISARRYSPDGGAPDVDPILDLGVHDIDAALRIGPRAIVHIDAGFAPYRTRIFSVVHADGVSTVLDLANRLVDNVAVDGDEPLAALWRDAISEEPGYRSLEHEAWILRVANYLIAKNLASEGAIPE